MKDIIKIILLSTCLIVVTSMIIFLGSSFKEQNISYAATSNSSDIQLMARAINGEARGEI